jgi:hypothetical protein
VSKFIRDVILVFFVIAALVWAFTSSWALIPDSHLGKSYTVYILRALQGCVLVFIVLLLSLPKNRIGPYAQIVIFTVAALMSWHAWLRLSISGQTEDQRVVLASECPKGPLQRISSCSGQATFNLMEPPIHYLAEGQPDPDICKTFLGHDFTKNRLDPKHSRCRESDPSDWSKKPCGMAFGVEGKKCFYCGSWPRQDRWAMYAIYMSDDCGIGQFMSTNTYYTPEYFFAEKYAAKDETNK